MRRRATGQTQHEDLASYRFTLDFVAVYDTRGVLAYPLQFHGRIHSLLSRPKLQYSVWEHKENQGDTTAGFVLVLLFTGGTRGVLAY